MSIFHVLKSIIRFIFLAKRNDYLLKDKFEIFKILSSIYIKDWLTRKNQEISQKIFGYKISAYDYRTLYGLFIEIFLSEVYYFESNKPDPKIIDCGANIGMAIIYFKKLYPDCTIIAFEPNPDAFTLLEKNVRQNGLVNVELNNIGLSNNSGEGEFFLGNQKGSIRASILKAKSGGENSILVNFQKLSSFITRNAKFDLIKMDIEGAENQVIEDLVSENRVRNSERYIIEYHHKVGSQKSKLSGFINAFEKCGFEYNIKADFKKNGVCQDVLLSIYREEDSANQIT